MKKLLVLTLLVLQLPVTAMNMEQKFKEDFAKGSAAFTVSGLPVYTKDGVRADGRGQVPEYARIAPPHPEKIPKARVTHPIEPYDSYYYNQVLGWHRPPYKQPIIPGYNMHYSTRIVKPYTLRNYIDVWCVGDKDYNQNMCSTKDFDIYFVHARNWAARATTLPFKIRKAKAKGHRVGLFLCVDFIGRDSEHVTDAKRFATIWDLPLFAASIDSWLPMDFFVD